MLVITGMPLKFYYMDWAQTMLDVMGGQVVAAVLHRIGALITIFYFSVHVISVIYGLIVGRQRFMNPDTGKLEFKRIRKDGTDVWLQASYNPIFDMDGRPFKIVKFASDITQVVEARSLALLEMSTPVTKIWDGVLFAPIVGIVDSRRSQDIMNKALSSIADHRARTLMLDIGGVAMVDTAVANHLIKIAKAAVLMGCKTIISGISPAIAQTITELGIELGSIQTTSTIESALREAVTRADPSGRTTGA